MCGSSWTRRATGHDRSERDHGGENVFGEAAFEDWAWRIPFLVSAVLVVVSYIIRRRLEESPLFEKLKASGATSTSPIRDAFGGSRWKLMLILLFGVVSGHAVTWYTGQFYALFFLQTVLHVPLEDAYAAVTIALVLGTPCFVLFGALSDRIGRKPIIMLAFVLAATTLIPVYHLMARVATTALVARTGNPYAGLWYPVAVTVMAFVVGAMLFRDGRPNQTGAPHVTGGPAVLAGDATAPEAVPRERGVSSR